jgi:flagellar hook protein FlgE
LHFSLLHLQAVVGWAGTGGGGALSGGLELSNMDIAIANLIVRAFEAKAKAVTTFD